MATLHAGFGSVCGSDNTLQHCCHLSLGQRLCNASPCNGWAQMVLSMQVLWVVVQHKRVHLFTTWWLAAPSSPVDASPVDANRVVVLNCCG
jgi:hypothetical protein